MDFESLWERIKELNALPYLAVLEIPSVISDETKELMANYSPEAVIKVVLDAIEEVNNGSVRPLDALIGDRLR